MESKQQSNESLHVLLVGRIYQQEDVFQSILLITNKFIKENQNSYFYFMDKKTKNKITALRTNLSQKCYDFSDNKSVKLTFLITIGGDGTILYAAKQLIHQNPPIIAFQRGTLGFMCRFKIQEIDSVIEDAIHSLKIPRNSQSFPFLSVSTMRIQSRKKIKGSKIFQQSRICMNQVFISRPTCERVILQIWVDGQLMTQTAGDGVLISTPTGSTAYSLSAGGPIMQNGVNGILIVPIAPNSLSFRPICIPSSCQIVLKISQNSRSQGYLSYDGQVNDQFHIGDELVIKKAKHQIQFYEYKNRKDQLPTWMKRLKQFLGWNESFNNHTQSMKPIKQVDFNNQVQ